MKNFRAKMGKFGNLFVTDLSKSRRSGHGVRIGSFDAVHVGKNLHGTCPDCRADCGGSGVGSSAAKGRYFVLIILQCALKAADDGGDPFIQEIENTIGVHARDSRVAKAAVGLDPGLGSGKSGGL